jgi:hypothetical protein
MTEEQESRSMKWVLPVALVLVVGGLVAIALVRGPAVFSADSPEGTVQEYLVAVSEERWEDAVAVVHPDWLGNCSGDDIALFQHGDFSAELGITDGFGGQIVREDFTSSAFPADQESEPLPEPDTEVEVTIIHQTSGGGLGSGWSEYVIFQLVDDGEFWWIVNDPWPYFVWNCREG